jgi:hypothetical protein
VFLLAAGLSSSVNGFGAAVLLLLLMGGALLSGAALFGWVLLQHDRSRQPTLAPSGEDFFRAD